MFLLLAHVCVLLCTLDVGGASTLMAPPQSALVVGFESAYDLSLLANTLSDQGIDATLLIPASLRNAIYDNLIDVEVIALPVHDVQSVSAEAKALRACEALLTDENVSKRIRELQPTFVVFPALRHDGCLLPWTKSIDSIPVVWTGNPDDELYAFHVTGVALPIHTGGFWSRLSAIRAWRSVLSNGKDNYVTPALKLVGKHLPDGVVDPDNLYADVDLLLRGADTILRSDFASLTQLLVEVGCHHCRGPLPLPESLHKPVIEHRLGAVIALLDDDYGGLIHDLARRLPQGRQGQAIVWKTNAKVDPDDKQRPANLYTHAIVDRQDLIGYGRARVVLSHCADTELLEAAFHGTAVICFPRNRHESRNSARAVELGFARSADELRDRSSGEELAGVVSDVHENGDYRENARRLSLAIRDRLNPASDRLLYYLRYVARNRDANGSRLLAAGKPARTFAEDSQLLLGVFVGSVIGIVATLGCMFARYAVLAGQAPRPKGRYAK